MGNQMDRIVNMMFNEECNSFFFDQQQTYKSLYETILEKVTKDGHDESCVFVLKSSDNSLVSQVITDISNIIGDRGIDHMLHVFFLDKGNYNDFKFLFG